MLDMLQTKNDSTFPVIFVFLFCCCCYILCDIHLYLYYSSIFRMFIFKLLFSFFVYRSISRGKYTSWL